MMKWYIAKLIFEITGDQFKVPQFDEQWRMISANSKDEALEKAHQIGESESETLMRANGEKMAWEFISITDMIPFSAEHDGSEIFSRIESPENVMLYLKGVEAKSAQFRTNALQS